MAKLVTLEEHMDRELPTVAIQATTEWEALLALVYIQEHGLGVHPHVNVSYVIKLINHSCCNIYLLKTFCLPKCILSAGVGQRPSPHLTLLFKLRMHHAEHLKPPMCSGAATV